MRLGNDAVAPFPRLQRGVGIAHVLQRPQDVHAADADRCGALAFPHESNRVAQPLIQAGAAQIVQRAVRQRHAKPDRRRVGVGQRRRHRSVLQPVAAGLHDQHRTVGRREVADIRQPIGQPLVAEDDAVICVSLGILGLPCPNREEDRAGAQEQRMRAMIQILSAEIPDIQAGRFRFPGLQQGGGHDNPVSRRHGRVIVLIL